MPIRLCQKCGLKVLIDESQAGTNPFYCQRCTTAMKGQENAPAPAAVRNPTPSPVASRSEPAAPSVGAAKAATVRVLCPYCKASFNGRVPQKPARGSCPVCQKELILLPNGDIKPAAGFDLGNWQSEPAAAKSPEPAAEPAAAEAKESGTRLLVKKYAADPGAAKSDAPPPPSVRPAARRPDPLETPSPVAASVDTDSSDDANPLPGWLDDSTRGSGEVRPQPDTDVNIDVVEPPKAEPEDRTIKVEDTPPPPPVPRARAPVAAKMPSMASGKPPAAVAPPPPPPAPAEEPAPEVDLLPPEPAKKPGRLGSGTRRTMNPQAPVAAAAVSEGGETGSGKVFLALILALLPVAACGGLLSSRDKLNHEIIKKVGARFSKGFAVLHKQMFPDPPPPKPVIEENKPEPEPPKEEPPKPDPEQQKKDGDKISNLFNEIRRGERDLKQSGVAASPEQQKELDKVRASLQEKKNRYAQLREMYQKMYGTDYDPEKQ